MFVYALKEVCSIISPGLWTTPSFMHVCSELKLNNEGNRENVSFPDPMDAIIEELISTNTVEFTTLTPSLHH